MKLKSLPFMLLVVPFATFAADFNQDMSFLIGKMPQDMIDDPRVFRALPKNIPKQDWEKIKERFQAASQIDDQDEYILMIGCKAHQCSTDAAIIAFNRLAHTTHVAYVENLDNYYGKSNVQIFQTDGANPNNIEPIKNFMAAHNVNMSYTITSTKPKNPPPMCKRAKTKAQKLVCSNADLSAKERELDAALKLAYKLTYGDQHLYLDVGQESWRADRDKCSNRECLLSVYNRRIAELNYVNSSPAARGQSASPRVILPRYGTPAAIVDPELPPNIYVH